MVLHLIFAKLGIAPWFAYVASAANCSDGPSRLDFSFAANVLRATWLKPVPLTRAQWESKPQDWIERRRPRVARDSGAQRRARKRSRDLLATSD